MYLSQVLDSPISPWEYQLRGPPGVIRTPQGLRTTQYWASRKEFEEMYGREPKYHLSNPDAVGKQIQNSLVMTK